MSASKQEEGDFLDDLNPQGRLLGRLSEDLIISGRNTHIYSPTRVAVAAALLLTILGFTIQIEAIAYYQDVLNWPKPFFSLYLTHSSLSLPWMIHLAYLRIHDRQTPYKSWLQHYVNSLADSVSSVDAFRGGITPRLAASVLLRVMAVVTGVLTISGLAWFVSLAYTTPGDLTAIYNCSAFFAAVFSVPLLKQKVGRVTIVAVALSIIGTLIIAYGDADRAGIDKAGTHRLFGNLVAAVGAVAFGLYSVLFKRWTDISRPTSSTSNFDLTIAASGLTGTYTLLIGWAGIILLHLLNLEIFVLPGLEVSVYLAISVLTGAMSMTLLLLLITWTTPVFGSVTSILSVFFVALADWLLFGRMPSPANFFGGGLIFVAFGLLARDVVTVAS